VLPPGISITAKIADGVNTKSLKNSPPGQDGFHGYVRVLMPERIVLPVCEQIAFSD
jgi:hypothetical protein